MNPEEITMKERLSFHLAQALIDHEPDEIGECLTHDDLSFLVAGKLSKTKREEMFAHIDACPNCYENWIAMPPPTPEKSFVLRIKEFFQDIAYWTSDTFQSLFIPKYTIPAFATALACFLIIYMQGKPTSTIEHHLTNGYQLVINASAPVELDLPWEGNQQKTMIGSKPHSLYQKAFALGLVKGKNSLMNTSTTLFSQKDCSQILENDIAQLFYIAGQWMILIKSAKIMDNDYSDAFWKGQTAILDNLMKKISNFVSKDKEVIDLSDKLFKLKRIWASQENIPKIKWRSQVGKINEQIIEQFSPRYLSTGE